MNWVLSHLPHIAILGILSFIGSFWYYPGGHVRSAMRWGGVVAILLAAGCGIYVAFAPPGREKTVDQENKPGPKPSPPLADKLEPLRQKWDSEDTADWPVAELLASISDTAYQTPVDAEASLREFGFESVKTFVDASMVGYVMSVRDITVVVFRGTDDRFDWFTNLNEKDRHTPQGMIHEGFYNSYQPLKPQIVKLIKAANPKHLWITGHSLGGALSVVCVYDLLAEQNQSFDGLITFGQPMIARSDLATYLDEQLIGRYVHYANDRDIVPRVPPGHSHCGVLVWFTASGIRRSKPKRMQYSLTQKDIATWSADDELTPLTNREFEQAKAKVRAADPGPEWSPDGKQVYRSSYPFLDDHAMSEYLAKIRSVNNTTRAK